MRIGFPRKPAVALAAVLMTAAATSSYGGLVASREGNIWDWKVHQPTEGQVLQQEKAAGVLQTPAQSAHEDAVLNQINRELLGKAAG
jgi:hypothetical protein